MSSHPRRSSPAATASSGTAIAAASASARLRVSPRRAGCGSRDSAASTFAQPAGLRRRAQLVRGADPERTPERHEPLRAKAEVAAQRHELGLDLALEFLELGDPSRVDELAQAPLDAGADSAQLTRAARAHELLDGRRGRADQVGGPPIRPDAPVRRAGEVERRRVGIEGAGDLGVVHRASVSPWRRW